MTQRDRERFSDQFFLPWTSVRENGTPVPYQMVFTDDAGSIRDRIRKMEDRIDELEKTGMRVTAAWRNREGTAFTEAMKELKRCVRAY